MICLLCEYYLESLKTLNMSIDQRLHCLITEITFTKNPGHDLLEDVLTDSLQNDQERKKYIK